VEKAIKGKIQGPHRRGEVKNMQDKRFEVSVQGVVDLLNEALRMDEHGVSDLVDERITVNKFLANHPTIQCVDTGRGRYEVGLLGFLNGLFGIDEAKMGAIEKVMDEKTKRVIGFKVREPWQGVMG
jgi:hypothetical protein